MDPETPKPEDIEGSVEELAPDPAPVSAPEVPDNEDNNVNHGTLYLSGDKFTLVLSDLLAM